MNPTARLFSLHVLAVTRLIPGRLFTTMALVVLTSIIASCQGPQERVQSRYETIPTGLAKQSEAAQRLHRQALDALDQEDLPRARELLRDALTQDIAYGPAHNTLGVVYLNQGDYYQAAWEFQYAANLMPDQPEPKNNLGLVFETVGQLGKAIEHYNDARAIAPDNPEILGNLARARLQDGRHDEETRAILKELVVSAAYPQT